MGTRTMVNYVDQGRILLDEEKTVFDEVGEGSEWVRLGEEQISVRGYLGRFLFSGERVNSKIRLLSGGERSRVIIAKILKRGGNVIVLDEPTNDLDLATLRVLEEALVGFGGVVVAVSHDRYFLNRVCTSILAFEGGGQLYYDVGNYDDYIAKRAAHKAEAARWQAEAAQLKTQAVAATSNAAKPAAGAQALVQGNARTRRHGANDSRRGNGSRAAGNPAGRARIFTGSTARAGRRQKSSSRRRAKRSRGCTRAGRRWRAYGRRRGPVRKQGIPLLDVCRAGAPPAA